MRSDFDEAEDKKAWKENTERARAYAYKELNKAISEEAGAKVDIAIAKTAINTIEETLKERKHTHGDFSKNAIISQRIKEVIRIGIKETHVILYPSMHEAFDMIASKISRILNGNPSEPDHWHDIAGYATLVEKELRNKNEQSKS